MKLIAAIALCCVFMVCAISAGDNTAEEIFADTSIKGGLIVHLGCGDGKLTAQLLTNDSYIVHGLDTSDANVKKAIANIRSLGVYGKISVAKLEGKHLPYAENMVNLLVSENTGDVAMDEIMQVLVPKGVAYISSGKSTCPNGDGSNGAANGSTATTYHSSCREGS